MLGNLESCSIEHTFSNHFSFQKKWLVQYQKWLSEIVSNTTCDIQKKMGEDCIHTAATKNVLSPISETTIIAMDLKKPCTPTK
jgi:hypothetical protein